MQNQDFLCEIGCEELPPKDLLNISNNFKQEVYKSLIKLELNFNDLKVFATPRRFAVLVKNLDYQQKNISNIIEGPNKKVSFSSDGNPTSALQGFMRKFDVNIADLDLTGEKVRFTQNISGKQTIDLLPQIIKDALANLPINKRMRWGANRYEFIRPLKWVVMLFGSQAIECETLGIKADNYSYGHRFHQSTKIIIDIPANYEQILEQAFVITDFEQRRKIIVEQINNLAQNIKAQALMPDNLLDEVTALVEYPQSLLCSFAPEFLEVPQEALITTMQDNQKYFCLTDENGKLLPNFITVANIASQDKNQVIKGNQKVVTARLSDAKFFFEQDKKTGINNLVYKLEQVTFQAELGSVWAKAQRISKLAEKIADELGEDQNFALRSGLLCKADLASSLVGEFPELQGVAGYYYALENGENLAVAKAIGEHYKPRFANDYLPSTKLGAIIALADKIDTLVGIFSIGLIPTGSKDPYALRRAAAGIVRICIEQKLDFSLFRALTISLNLYSGVSEDELESFHISPYELDEQIYAFIFDRLAVYLSEQNIDLKYLEAVKEKEETISIFDTYVLIKELKEFSQKHQADKLLENFKRITNLLDKEDIDYFSNVNTELFQDPYEQNLYQILVAQQSFVEDLINQKNKKYDQVLNGLCDFNYFIEQFFVNVMVNIDNQELRKNRLKLLFEIKKLFMKVADFSKL